MGQANWALPVITAAATLSSAAPAEWRVFLSAVKLRADDIKSDVVNSTLENLQVNQGRAREAVIFAEILEHCREQADVINRKK